MKQKREHEEVEKAPREPRAAMQGEDESQRELGGLEPGRVASLLTSCIWCRQLHQPERPFEFHPLCPVCIQTGG